MITLAPKMQLFFNHLGALRLLSLHKRASLLIIDVSFRSICPLKVLAYKSNSKIGFVAYNFSCNFPTTLIPALQGILLTSQGLASSSEFRPRA